MDREKGRLYYFGELVFWCAVYVLVSTVSINIAPGEAVQSVACVLMIGAIFVCHLIVSSLEHGRLSGRQLLGFLDIAGMKKSRFLILIIACAGGVGLNMLMSGLLPLLPFPKEWFEAYGEASGELSKPNALLLVDTVIFVPLFEEIFYRGIMLDRLSRILPVPLAIPLAAIIFGLAHTSPLWVVYASAIGLVICTVYHFSGSILPCVLLHIAFNGVNYLLPPREGTLDNVLTMLIGLVVSGACAAAFVLAVLAERKRKAALGSEKG